MAEIIKNISKTILFCRSRHVMFGEVEYLPSGSYGPLMGLYYQVLLLHSGEMDVMMGGKTIKLPVGSMFLLKPKLPIFLRFSKKMRTRHSWCAVFPDAVQAPLQRLLNQTAGPLPIPSTFQDLMTLGLSTANFSSVEVEGLRHHLGIALLHNYLCCCDIGKSSSTPRSDVIDRSMVYLEKNYMKPLTVPILARACGVTPAHLNKLFLRHVKTTPSRFLWELRTERGADLLLQTSLTIGEVAYRSGFQNPFHFSRLIRKRYRMSPGDFRSGKWEKVV